MGAGHVNPSHAMGRRHVAMQRAARSASLARPAGCVASHAQQGGRHFFRSHRASDKACTQIRTGRVQYCTVRTWVKAASAATRALCRSLLNSSAGAAAADESTRGLVTLSIAERVDTLSLREW